jgi:hypothetical protein
LVQFQRGRVDAVAQAAGRRAICEDVAEVGTAVVTGDFGTAHAEAAVDVLIDQFFIVRCVKAGPAAARVKLGFGTKERGAATGTVIGAGVVAVPVLTSKGPLGALFAGYMILVGRKLGAPLGVGLFDFWHGNSWLVWGR